VKPEEEHIVIDALVPLAPDPVPGSDAALAELRKMVLLSVVSPHTRRNYAKAIDELFAYCAERRQPLTRSVLIEYRASMLERGLSATTINVRLPDAG